MQQVRLTYGEQKVKDFYDKVSQQMEEQMEQKLKEQQLEEKKSTAKNLLEHLTDEQISVAVKLSIEEVRAIRLEVEGEEQSMLGNL